MLSISNSKTVLSSFSNTKCAEIYFQTLDNFSIICSFCEIKNFDFQDYVLHFRNVHLEGFDAATKIKNEFELPLKLDDDDPSFFLKDISLLSDKEPDDNLQLQNLTRKNAKSINSESSWSSSGDMDSDDGVDVSLTSKVLKQTAGNSQPKLFQCNQCGVKYKVRKSLAIHKIKVHNKEKEQRCTQCESVFSDERSLEKHVRRDHTEYPCDQCDKIYKNKRSLEYHMSKHSGVRDFVCDIENCGKAFYNKKRLTAHKNFAHNKERKYVCEICGFGVKSKQALDTHTRSHTGEKPFACEECGKGFASSSQVSEHKAIHSSEKPHVCDVCGAAFARPKALYHHKHLHLGIKKFVCKICGKAYAQAAGLCGHMRQHKANLI